MTPAFGTLRNDHVGAGLRRPHGLWYPARHERDLAACGMRALHVLLYVLLRRWPGKGDHGRAQCESRCESVFLEIEQEEVQGEWSICKLSNRCRPDVNLLRRQVVAAHCSQAARTGHGRHKFRGVDRSHAAKRDRMIDL